MVPTGVMTAALQNASFWLGSGALTALPCLEQSSSASSPARPAAQLPSHSSLCATPFGGCPPPAPYISHVPYCISTIYRQNLFPWLPAWCLFPRFGLLMLSCCKHCMVLCTKHVSGRGFSLQHDGDEPLLLLLLSPLSALVCPKGASPAGVP